jgi:hypothetical protein
MFLWFKPDITCVIQQHSSWRIAPSRKILVVFDLSKHHPKGYYGDYMDNRGWEVPAGSGMTLAKSLAVWMAGATGDAAMHVDPKPWPANQPCHTDGELGLGLGLDMFQ